MKGEERERKVPVRGYQRGVSTYMKRAAADDDEPIIARDGDEVCLCVCARARARVLCAWKRGGMPRE